MLLYGGYMRGIGFKWRRLFFWPNNKQTIAVTTNKQIIVVTTSKQIQQQTSNIHIKQTRNKRNCTFIIGVSLSNQRL